MKFIDLFSSSAPNEFYFLSSRLNLQNYWSPITSNYEFNSQLFKYMFQFKAAATVTQAQVGSIKLPALSSTVPKR